MTFKCCELRGFPRTLASNQKQIFKAVIVSDFVFSVVLVRSKFITVVFPYTVHNRHSKARPPGRWYVWVFRSHIFYSYFYAAGHMFNTAFILGHAYYCRAYLTFTWLSMTMYRHKLLDNENQHCIDFILFDAALSMNCDQLVWTVCFSMV